MDAVAFLGDLDEALAQAGPDRPALILFWQDTSADSAKLAYHTLSDAAVAERLSRLFVPVKIGVHERPDLAEHYRVRWTPCHVVVDPDGRECYRETGFLPPAEFLVFLEFSRAMADLAGRRYAAARERLERLRREEPDSPRAPEVLYWLGVAAMASEHDPASLGQYWAELVENHPDSLAARRVPPPEPRL